MTKFNQPQALQDINSPDRVAQNPDNKKKGEAMIDAEERNAESPQAKDKAPLHDLQQEPRKVSGGR